MQSTNAAIMRNALTLQEKNLLTIHAETKSIIKLTAEGKSYAKDGLPERKLILATAELGGSADLKKAAEKAGLQQQFVQIALGWLYVRNGLFCQAKLARLTFLRSFCMRW
jgi:phenylalanyl-tRNA synthetase alpha chain